MVLQLPPKPDDEKATPFDELTIDPDRPTDEFEEPLVERGTIPELSPKQIPGYVLNALGNILAPQDLTGGARWFYRPMLFVAIGMHLLLFFAPNAKDSDKKIPKKKEKPVAITKISTGKVKKKPPKVKIKAKPKLPKVKLAKPKAPIIKPSPKPTPQPSPSPQAGKPSPKPSPLPSVSPMPPGGNNTDPNNPFADFPHIGVKNSDDEYVVTGKQLSDVVGHFKKELPPRKYTANTSDEGSGYHIIEFAKGGKNAYLNMFEDNGNILYVIAGSPVQSLALWRGATKDPEILGNIMATLPSLPGVEDGSVSESPEPDDFSNPNQFFDDVDNEQLKSTIGVNRVVSETDPMILYEEHIEPEFVQQGFKLARSGDYGGGPLWKVEQGKTLIYLNLIAVPNKNGVAVVFWREQPS